MIAFNDAVALQQLIRELVDSVEYQATHAAFAQMHERGSALHSVEHEAAERGWQDRKEALDKISRLLYG